MNPAQVANAGKLFASNVWTGWIILGGLSLDLFYSRHRASKSSSLSERPGNSLEDRNEDLNI